MSRDMLCCCNVESNHELIDTRGEHHPLVAASGEGGDQPQTATSSTSLCGASTQLADKFPKVLVPMTAPPGQRGGAHLIDPLTVAGKKRAFTAVLCREEGEDWGLQLDVTDGRIMYICEVDGGHTPTGRYNAGAGELDRLQAGDYITVINGQAASTVPSAEATAKVRSNLSYAKALKIRVVGAQVFEAAIDKTGRSLGVQLSHSNKGGGLIISDIEDGAVRESAPKVQIGDRIVDLGGVPGAAGSPDSLLQALRRAANQLLLIISRPQSDDLQD